MSASQQHLGRRGEKKNTYDRMIWICVIHGVRYVLFKIVLLGHVESVSPETLRVDQIGAICDGQVPAIGVKSVFCVSIC